MEASAQSAPLDPIIVRIDDGAPSAIDALAPAVLGGHRFLRAIWYDAAQSDASLRTIVATRADGRPLAAIPTVEIGPTVVGTRTVPGSYWPFRAIPIADDADPAELTALFADPQVKSALAPLWRLGPVYRDDPATLAVKRAAASAGWTVLTRPLGRTFLFDLAAMCDDKGWPRKSTRRRLANYERQLALSGEIRVRTVTGANWREDVFGALAAIERASWVGASTDGSGAKFLEAGQRTLWHQATRDPHIARALSATILYVGEVPAAFSFDLRAGDIQYSIASSFDARFAAYRPGKIVTYRQLERAAEAGVRIVDLGAGDSGYKREMGATPGAEIVDLLIVRSRTMARLLSLRWGAESRIGRDAFRPAKERGDLERFIQPLLAAGALAAAAYAISE